MFVWLTFGTMRRFVDVAFDSVTRRAQNYTCMYTSLHANLYIRVAMNAAGLRLQGGTFGSAAQLGRLLNSCWASDHSALHLSVLIELHSPDEGRYSV